MKNRISRSKSFAMNAQPTDDKGGWGWIKFSIIMLKQFKTVRAGSSILALAGFCVGISDGLEFNRARCQRWQILGESNHWRDLRWSVLNVAMRKKPLDGASRIGALIHWCYNLLWLILLVEQPSLLLQMLQLPTTNRPCANQNVTQHVIDPSTVWVSSLSISIVYGRNTLLYFLT